MSKIIGRKQEIEELERLYRSGRPEFVAVYGRRRIGKILERMVQRARQYDVDSLRHSTADFGSVS